MDADETNGVGPVSPPRRSSAQLRPFALIPSLEGKANAWQQVSPEEGHTTLGYTTEDQG